MVAPLDEEPFVDETAHAPARATLIFDGDDALCRRAVARWRSHTNSRVEWIARQRLGDRFADVPRAQLAASPTLVLPSGEILTGSKAILRALHEGGARSGWFFYRRYVGFALLVDVLFRFVARRRAPLARVARVLAGPDERPPTHFIARFLFLRGLAVVALCAFLSVRAQLDGLIGSRGILPASSTIAAVRAWAEENHYGALATFRRVPTLFLCGSSDRALHAVTTVGVVASVFLLVDLASPIALATIWLCYLSIVTTGEAFFHFQWDALLLESCLVAAFVVPWRLRPRLPARASLRAIALWARERAVDRTPPRRSGLWLMRLLVFKLMFLSGVVKLTSHDPAWSSLTALDYHYFTQPIPTWTAWYAHHAPAWVRHASVAATFLIEIFCPFLLFFGRRARRAAFVFFTLLMVGIAATGNYGFFNLLSVVLFLVLLDDGAFPARLRRLFDVTDGNIEVAGGDMKVTNGDMQVAAGNMEVTKRNIHVTIGHIARAVRRTAALLVAAVSVTYVALAFVDDPREALPGVWVDVLELVEPFDSIDSYGLFRTMTKKRPEIVVEGSDDGVTWKSYEFRWKPGDPSRRPEIIGVHMPRLDWEMWFAALEGHCTRSRVYLPFVRALLEGSPPVRALLANDPFGDRPPMFIRSTLWEYTFTTAEERARTGAWWSRRRLGLYCPTVALQDGELVPVEP